MLLRSIDTIPSHSPLKDLLYAAADVIDEAVQTSVLAIRAVDLYPPNAHGLCCSDELLVQMKDW